MSASDIDVEKTREEFERFAKVWGWNLRRWPDGRYQGTNASAGWTAFFQARVTDPTP